MCSGRLLLDSASGLRGDLTGLVSTAVALTAKLGNLANLVYSFYYVAYNSIST